MLRAGRALTSLARAPLRIGCVVIGESPRPDLTEPLVRALRREHEHLPHGVQVVCLGALDQFSQTDTRGLLNPFADQNTEYPLHTIYRGQPVSLDEGRLVAWVGEALSNLDRIGVSVKAVMCAGSFAALRDRDCILPFDATVNFLLKHGKNDEAIAVACGSGQAAATSRRWKAAGFSHVEVEELPSLHELPSETGLCISSLARTYQTVVVDWIGLSLHQEELPGNVITMDHILVQTISGKIKSDSK